MPTRLIIDTDIGTDVDDLWTLMMLPGLEHVRLEAVTVVYGDTELRARLAAWALAAMGIDAPVYRGCETTLSGKAVLWAGHEGLDVHGIDDAQFADGDAVDVLIERAATDPGTLDILAIGPLTNIATAIERDAAFRDNVRHLTLMGGEFRVGWPEHNFASDANATQIVLGSGIPTTIMPLDQTMRVMLDHTDVDRIAANHPIGASMTTQAQHFWKWLSSVAPGMPGNASAPHDPMALLAIADPSLFQFANMVVEMNTEAGLDGKVIGTPDSNSRTSVVTRLDPSAVHDALMRAWLPMIQRPR